MIVAVTPEGSQPIYIDTLLEIGETRNINPVS